jgi:cytochrome P450
MLDTDELLARLEERGIRNVDIARTLGLPDSRVPEIKRKERALKLDEGAKLVRAFGLEQEPRATPIPPQMIQLSVRYVAAMLGVPRERLEAQMGELTATLRAFSEFVSDPKVRRSIESAEGFFQAMLLRPRAESEAPPGTDPERTH